MTYLLVCAGCGLLSHKIIDSVNHVCGPKAGCFLADRYFTWIKVEQDYPTARGFLRIVHGRANGSRMLTGVHWPNHWPNHWASTEQVTERCSAFVNFWARTRGVCILVCRSCYTTCLRNKKTAGTRKCAPAVKVTGSCSVRESPTLLVELLLNRLLRCPGAHRTPQSVGTF